MVVVPARINLYACIEERVLADDGSVMGKKRGPRTLFQIQPADTFGTFKQMVLRHRARRRGGTGLAKKEEEEEWEIVDEEGNEFSEEGQVTLYFCDLPKGAETLFVLRRREN
jgi:hypothetical protein